MNIRSLLGEFSLEQKKMGYVLTVLTTKFYFKLIDLLGTQDVFRKLK